MSSVTITGYAVHYLIYDSIHVTTVGEVENVAVTECSITLNEDRNYHMEITVRSRSKSLPSFEVAVDIPDRKTS